MVPGLVAGIVLLGELSELLISDQLIRLKLTSLQANYYLAALDLTLDVEGGDAEYLLLVHHPITLVPAITDVSLCHSSLLEQPVRYAGRDLVVVVHPEVTVLVRAIDEVDVDGWHLCQSEHPACTYRLVKDWIVLGVLLVQMVVVQPVTLTLTVVGKDIEYLRRLDVGAESTLALRV